jgi:hypothetical protein
MPAGLFLPHREVQKLTTLPIREWLDKMTLFPPIVKTGKRPCSECLRKASPRRHQKLPALMAMIADDVRDVREEPEIFLFGVQR